MIESPSERVELMYPQATLEAYFDSDKVRQMARIQRSVDAANEFRATHTTESVLESGHKIKLHPLPQAL